MLGAAAPSAVTGKPPAVATAADGGGSPPALSPPARSPPARSPPALPGGRAHHQGGRLALPSSAPPPQLPPPPPLRPTPGSGRGGWSSPHRAARIGRVWHAPPPPARRRRAAAAPSVRPTWGGASCVLPPPLPPPPLRASRAHGSSASARRAGQARPPPCRVVAATAAAARRGYALAGWLSFMGAGVDGEGGFPLATRRGTAVAVAPPRR